MARTREETLRLSQRTYAERRLKQQQLSNTQLDLGITQKAQEKQPSDGPEVIVKCKRKSLFGFANWFSKSKN